MNISDADFEKYVHGRTKKRNTVNWKSLILDLYNTETLPKIICHLCLKVCVWSRPVHIIAFGLKRLRVTDSSTSTTHTPQLPDD